MTEAILRVQGLDVRYAAFQALFGLTVEVAPGSVLAVLGANGAGKSTFAATISGSSHRPRAMCNSMATTSRRCPPTAFAGSA